MESGKGPPLWHPSVMMEYFSVNDNFDQEQAWDVATSILDMISCMNEPRLAAQVWANLGKYLVETEIWSEATLAAAFAESIREGKEWAANKRAEALESVSVAGNA